MKNEQFDLLITEEFEKWVEENYSDDYPEEEYEPFDRYGGADIYWRNIGSGLF